MEKNRYEIRYTETFKKDIERVFKYIVNVLKNNIAAENLVQLIEKEIKKRSENPESFKVFKRRQKGNLKWYRIIVNSYVIFYTVDNNIVTFRRFLYSRRNFDKLI